MQNSHLRIVLLAGGRGDRLWPLSSPECPKQFLNLDGSGSFLQQTFWRARGLVHPQSIYVSTGAEYAALVLEQLKEIDPERLILEPVGRDTAPGLALAAAVLAQEDPDAVMLALPSDHVIQESESFLQALHAAIAAAQAHDVLVTLGIRPTRAETGYGYVRLGAPVGEFAAHTVHRVDGFTEKPDASIAAGYLQSGQYLWNAGIFCWRVRVLEEEIARYLPELDAVVQDYIGLGNGSSPETRLETFARAPRVSIDYGVLEKSNRVIVVPASFGWDDVGNWAAVDRVQNRDSRGNCVHGRALLHDSQNVVVQASGRLVAGVGISDLIIVDTDDTVLVCHKDHAQDVRLVAAQAEGLGPGRARFPPSPATGKVVEKPWGREVWWAQTEHYAGKLLEVSAGHSLSVQFHRRKHETMYFQRGRGRLLVGEEWQQVYPGLVVTISPGTVHQLVAVTDLALVEVSTPDMDDVVRLSDRYGRVPTNER